MAAAVARALRGCCRRWRAAPWRALSAGPAPGSGGAAHVGPAVDAGPAPGAGLTGAVLQDKLQRPQVRSGRGLSGCVVSVGAGPEGEGLIGWGGA